MPLQTPLSQDIQKALELELDSRDKTTASLEKDVRHLTERLFDQEQYSRRNCLIVHGIPESPQHQNTENQSLKWQSSLTSSYALKQLIGLIVLGLTKKHRVSQGRDQCQVCRLQLPSRLLPFSSQKMKASPENAKVG